MPAPVSTLAELIAPQSPDAFRTLLAERTSFHQPALDPGRFAALIDWNEMIALVKADGFPADRVRLTQKRNPLSSSFYRRNGAIDAVAIDRLIDAGTSIVLNNPHQYVPAIGTLCDTLAGETGEHVACTAIATTGEGGAFDLHYDSLDVLVLQIEGSKRWAVHGDDPVINPVRDMPVIPADSDTRPSLDLVLNPGDWLFVPGGCRHQCDVVGDRSLHLSIVFYPLSIVRAVDLILRDLMANPADRAPLRYAVDQAAAVEAKLKRRLIERIDALSLDELLRRHRATGLKPRPSE